MQKEQTSPAEIHCMESILNKLTRMITVYEYPSKNDQDLFFKLIDTASMVSATLCGIRNQTIEQEESDCEYEEDTEDDEYDEE